MVLVVVVAAGRRGSGDSGRRRRQVDTAASLSYLAFGEVPPLGERTKMRWQSRESGEAMNFQLFLPRRWHEGDASWPMLVFLHGSGDGVFEVMNSQSLPRLLSRDQSTSFDPTPTWTFEFPEGVTYSNASFAESFEMVVLMPQGWTSHADSGWYPDRARRVVELVRDVVGAYGVDEDRISLTGQSAGGVGAWMLAAIAPKMWAAVVPICGASPVEPVVLATKLEGLPAWVFHAADDVAMPVELSDEVVDAIRAFREREEDRAPLEYTRYARAPAPPDPRYADMTGHASYDLAFRDARLYAWLLAQRRRPHSGPAS
ncbi:hypothetical protein CTAYLR_010665 [Chrysophaeum taylorii]|uniref:Phospholipase/carboxylesterase/thioesterase domain-containing protein n=1 Tax=Chrysophaeum taylorii TaxID=2483200 RepID=A0AAD7XGW4_9STRA|nr:hypothetical protein CTAYLR_010665 [Chrysophaeum taylorii]